MNTHFTYNFVEKTILGSKRSIDRANKGLSPEYTELTHMLAEHPDFSVAVKTIKQNKNKKTYNNLTIEKMEAYIKLQENGEETIIEFKALQELAKAMGAKYPLCKKWFLEKYPEFKKATDKTVALANAKKFIENMGSDITNLPDEKTTNENETAA